MTIGQKSSGMARARAASRFGWRVLTRPPTETFRRLIAHCLLTTPLVYGDSGRLVVASTAVVNNALFNLLSGRINVEDHVIFGHNVSLLTGTHDTGAFDEARIKASPRSGRDIVIEQGAWLASNVVILGNCRVGRSAVVAAGSVVTRDVPPFTVVAGVPATVLRFLDVSTPK